jgi:hypothetical protein
LDQQLAAVVAEVEIIKVEIMELVDLAAEELEDNLEELQILAVELVAVDLNTKGGHLLVAQDL